MTGALFDPDAIVKAVRAAANVAPPGDNRDFATNPAECRNVAIVAMGDALASDSKCRKVAIVATPIAPIDAEAVADAIEERAAILSCPAAYRDTFARLKHQKPLAVSDAEWRLAVNDAGLFLDIWGAEAAALGLTPGDLFDVRAGLVWRLAGERVDALCVDASGVDHVRLCDGRTIRKGACERRWPNSIVGDEDRGGTHETD